MREIRTSGSEGGGAELNRLSLPLSRVPDLARASGTHPAPKGPEAGSRG